MPCSWHLNGKLALFAGLCAAILVLGNGGCSRKVADDPYLVRVGSSSISVVEFQQAVDAAVEEAFPGDAEVDKTARDDLRMRVFNQLVEELLIVEKAKALGIELSQAEIDQAVDAIKADYPDNTFEETLLESAISFANWKKKLIRRLQVNKVVERELVDKVQITSQDVAGYIKDHFPQGPPAQEDMDAFNQKVVFHLRQQKAEQAYKEWIESLRQTFPVDINQEEWRRMDGGS